MTDVAAADGDAAGLSPGDEQVIRELTARARSGGRELTGEDSLPGKLTKMVAGEWAPWKAGWMIISATRSMTRKDAAPASPATGSPATMTW